jgi:glycerol-3-phosphate O-acyltransferase
MTSQLVAFTAFEMIRKNFKKLDVFGILRLPPEDTELPYDEFVKTCGRLLEVLRQMQKDDKIKLTHSKKNGNIMSPDLKLLYFYHNRLEGYGLEKYV